MFFCKKNTFILFIFFTYISFFINGCKNVSIQSQYSKKTINGEKLCTFVNIENHQSKVFANKLDDNPFASQRPNCDYFLVANISHNDSPITSVAGVRMEGKIDMSASYALYAYDKTKDKQVQNILDNPLIRSYDEYTSSRNSSMSKTSIINQESQVLAQDYSGSRRSYGNTIGRLNNVLKRIGSGSENETMTYLNNVTIITSEEQNKYDVEEQLAKTLAEEIINDIAIDIADYKEQIQTQLQQPLKDSIDAEKNTTTTTKKLKKTTRTKKKKKNKLTTKRSNKITNSNEKK